jgi:transferase CAF17, mitochondrial
VFLYPYTNSLGQRGYLLDYDSRPSEAPPLLSMLKRYVLRSKVKISDVSEGYDVWAAWGCEKDNIWDTERKWNWAPSGAVEPAWNNLKIWPWGEENLVLRDRRAVGMGKRMLLQKGDLREL